MFSMKIFSTTSKVRQYKQNIIMIPAVSCAEAITSGAYAKYPEAVSLISQAADHLDITGKTVLVIGSEAPWVETILLMRKPRCYS